MTTRIYLDVDGVINAVSYAPPTEATGLGDWKTGKALGYTIQWSQEVIDFLNDLATREDVEIVWLTTWMDHAATDLVELTGINGADWYVLKTDDMHHSFGNWWKYDIIVPHLDENPVDKVIWIDDDLDYMHRLVEDFVMSRGIHTLSPHTSAGLTRGYLDAIMEIVDE